MPSLFSLFSHPSKSRKSSFAPEQYRPALRVSICTGEQTAGFQDRQTGAFVDVMQVRGERELADFCREYGVDKGEIVRIY